ncbi:MAG: Sensory Transduction Protein Kinase [Fibrobacteres bacterium]|nr:Sensory Transduction Protein Kinase [Fibrobacterota bacterium]
MNNKDLYDVLKEAVRELAHASDLFSPLPAMGNEEAALESIGLDPLLLPDIVMELKKRFGGKDLSSCLANPSALVTLGDFLDSLSTSLAHGIAAPCMVYVDDEDSNLFVFKRRFDKYFSIKYFSDPLAALEFILNDATVALVLTDEVMPGLTGNQLCDRVHALKPAVKFILLTGNPNNQDDLLYHSMRRNRFFEFLRKPLDFENRSDELRNLFASILETDGMPK